jgi:hypothetical protein
MNLCGYPCCLPTDISHSLPWCAVNEVLDASVCAQITPCLVALIVKLFDANVYSRGVCHAALSVWLRFTFQTIFDAL